MNQQMLVERYSANDDELEVLFWYVEDGTYVSEGDPIVDLESAKAMLTVESKFSGYIKRGCQVGDIVPVGAILAEFEIDGQQKEIPKVKSDSVVGVKRVCKQEELVKEQERVIEKQEFQQKVIPSVKETTEYNYFRLSRNAEAYVEEHNIPLELFEGRGLLSLEDVKRIVQPAQTESQESKMVVHAAKTEVMEQKTAEQKETIPSNVRVQKLPRSKQLEIEYLKSGLAEGLSSSVTLELDSADIRKALPEYGLQENQLIAVIIYELCKLLKKYPELNSYYQDKQIFYYDEINIGLAMDMGKGLKVPIIHDASQYSQTEIFEKMMDYLSAYMENKLSVQDLTGGTFTISDLSNTKITHFQPLINKNQAAILGIGGNPEAKGAPISFTLVFDHRVLSGRLATDFLNDLVENLKSYMVVDTVTDREFDYEKEKIETQESVANEMEEDAYIELDFSTDIAVIGMDGRFPGADNLPQFWENIKNGKECITFFTDEELRKNGVSEKDLANPNYVKAQPVLKDADCFDAEFFRYSNREAQRMDPQQRLILQSAWHALEDAGYAPDSIEKITGVYLSTFWNTYVYDNMWMPDKMPNMSPSEFFQTMVGSDKDFLASRVSYKLNLKGPAMTVQTACSSSMVGIHLACQSLLTGECDMALAGGSSIMFPQNTGYMYQKNMIFSPDGHCRAFDAQAEGTVFGNGVGIMVLKRYEDAVRDGDNVYAIIKGTAINNDGSLKADYTSPSIQGQRDVIKQAIDMARVDPETISFVETHGTGTKIGDPIEISALTQAYETYTDKKNYCAIGSVKTNIGHLNSIAAMPSLFKTIYSLKEKVLTPIVHFQTPNNDIDFKNSPFYVNTELKEWDSEFPRRAGVSSFGIGGTNAHAILEEAPEIEKEEDTEPVHLFVLSARTKESLENQVQELRDRLKVCGKQERLSDISYTLALGRTHFPIRLAFLAATVEEAIEILDDIANKHAHASEEAYCNQKQAATYLAHDLTQQPCGNEPSLMELGECLLWRLEDSENMSKEEYVAKLLALGDLFVKGYAFDWNKFFSRKKQYRVSLPGYAFAKIRYSMPLQVQKKEKQVENVTQTTSSVKVISESLHPMLDKNVSTLMEVAFEKTFTDQEFFIRDHVVQGRMILPGMGYLELVRAAGSLAKKNEKVTSIQNVVWSSPIALVNGQAPVKVIVKQGDHALQFQVLNEGNTQKITQYAQGKIGFENEAFTVNELNVEHIKKKVEKGILGTSVYENFWNAGLQYGEAFQTIQSMVIENNSVYSMLTLSDDTNQYPDLKLNPALLDGAIQTISGFYYGKENGLFLPMSLKKIIFKDTYTKNCYVQVRRLETKNSDIGKFDVTIYDESGSPIVEMQEVLVRLVKGKLDAQDKQLTVQNDLAFLYKKSWQESFACQNEAVETLLVFARETDDVKMYESCASRVIKVKASDVFKKVTDDAYEVNVETEEDYETLLKEIGVKKFAVLYLWNASDWNAGFDTMEKNRVYGTDAIFYLSKAIMKSLPRLEVQFFLINEKQNPLESAFNLSNAGILKCLSKENPSVVIHVVTIDEATKHMSGLETIIKKELISCNPEDMEIRYIAERRFVKRYEKIQETMNKQTLKEEGVYVITGGLGGLGYLLASYLSEKYHAKLGLTGRSPLTKEKQEKLAQIEALGGRVLYVAADINNQEDVVKTMKTVQEQFGKVDGIIHAAGVLNDQLLKNKDVQTFHNVLEAKVNGTINLDLATKDDQLDFMVFFSSATALTGNNAQSDYATANSFLDEFAENRNMLVERKERFGKTISINWPIWEEGTMRPAPAAVKYIENQTGMQLLSTEKGMDAFERALSLDLSQVIVLDGKEEKLQKTFDIVAISQQPEVKETIVNSTSATTLSSSKVDEILVFLMEQMAELLGIDEDSIDSDKDLEDYGADSIIIMEFINAIAEKYGIEILPGEIYEVSSLHGVEQYIKEKLHMDDEKVQLEPKVELKDESQHPEKVAKPIKVEQVRKKEETASTRISDMLLEQAGELLGLDKEEIDLDKDLEDYGADSISMMEMMNTINENYEVELMPNDFYDYPTIRQLSAYIASLCGEKMEIQEEVKVQDVDSNSNIHVITHPFVQDAYVTADGIYEVKKSFMLETDPMFYDHIVLGLPRLQAVGYLEMMYAASKCCEEYNINHISDVALFYPISILEGISNDAVTSFTKMDNGSFAIEINSTFAGKELKNAKAVANRIALEPKIMDIEMLKSQFARQLTQSEFMLDAIQENNYVGPYFYANKEVYIEDSRSFGKLMLSEKARSMKNEFMLHPGLLDPCVYMAMGIGHAKFNNAGKVVYLPIYFKDVIVYDNINTECYCLVEYAGDVFEDKKVLNYNITCCDDSGKVLIEIKGLQLKRVPEGQKGETMKILEHIEGGEKYKVNRQDIMKRWQEADSKA